MSHGRLPGAADADGDTDGDPDGDTEGDGDEDGDPEATTPPVHVVPLSANDAGTGLLPVHPPLKPNATDAPVPMPPLYDTFVAVTAPPDWVTVAFHAWVTVCPAAKFHVNRQPLTGSP